MVMGDRTSNVHVCSKSKELLVQYIMDMILLFLASIIQRGNDLLKEQLYKDYDVAYFQHANSHMVPLK